MNMKEEYAVDTYPNYNHLDTVLASTPKEAARKAVDDVGEEQRSTYGLYVVHHMPTGDETRVEI